MSADTMPERVRQFGLSDSHPVENPGLAGAKSQSRLQRPSFAALLVRAGLASDQEARDAVTEGLGTGERLGEVVIRKGWATEEQVAQLLAEQWQLPFMAAASISVDPIALQQVPLAVAQRLGGLPIGFDGERVILAIAEPTEDLFAEAEAEDRVGDASFVVVARSVLEPLLGGFREAAPVPEETAVVAGTTLEDPSETLRGFVETAALPVEPARPEEEDPGFPATGVAASTDGPLAGGAEAALRSIDSATAELQRVRDEVTVLGRSLAVARDQLAEQEEELEAAEELRERDADTIRRLERELGQRADLFETLKAQVVSLAETLETGTAT